MATVAPKASMDRETSMLLGSPRQRACCLLVRVRRAASSSTRVGICAGAVSCSHVLISSSKRSSVAMSLVLS
jgi:hypothetical protein